MQQAAPLLTGHSQAAVILEHFFGELIVAVRIHSVGLTFDAVGHQDLAFFAVQVVQQAQRRIHIGAILGDAGTCKRNRAVVHNGAAIRRLHRRHDHIVEAGDGFGKADIVLGRGGRPVKGQAGQVVAIQGVAGIITGVHFGVNQPSLYH